MTVDRRRDNLLRLADVLARTRLSRTTIYRRIAAGTFPPSYPISDGLVAWYESDIDAWRSDPVGWCALPTPPSQETCSNLAATPCGDVRTPNAATCGHMPIAKDLGAAQDAFTDMHVLLSLAAAIDGAVLRTPSAQQLACEIAKMCRDKADQAFNDYERGIRP